MRVKEIMTENPVTVPADTPVRVAAGLMNTHHIGGLPVMEGETLVGIVTESDILALLETGRISDDLWLPSPLEIIEVPIRELVNWEKTKSALSDIGNISLREVMSHPPITIDEEADIEDAAHLMRKERIARLPVLRDGRLAGIVTRADIVHGLGGGRPEERQK